MADSITHSQSLNVLLSHVDTLSFTICQPGPGSAEGEGNEEAQPAVCSHTLPPGCVGLSRSCMCATNTTHYSSPSTFQRSPHHKVCNSISSGTNLGKSEGFSLIDRVKCRAVPLQVRPFTPALPGAGSQ